MKTIDYFAMFNKNASSFPLSLDDWRTIVKAARRLSRWCELECNGNIYRDENNKCYWRNSMGYLYPYRDYETSALKRITQICEPKGLYYYYQTDPRGEQVYLSNVPLDSYNYCTGYCVITR